MMKVSRKLFISFSLICLLGLGVLFVPSDLDCKAMAILSIAEVILLYRIIKRCYSSTVYILFFFAITWLFHSGQLFKYAFSIPGSVWLDFLNYGSPKSIVEGFRFYYICVQFVGFGILLYKCTEKYGIKKRKKTNKYFNSKYIAIALIACGILPRIYIDIIRLFSAASLGYSTGVNGLPFPTVVQATAFFFDAGACILFISLIEAKNKEAVKILFYTVAIYKLMAMLSGARQDALCFLIIWFYLYFSNTHRISFKNSMLMILVGYIGLVFIQAIGEAREKGLLSFDQIIKTISLQNTATFMGDILGEFGSAFCTVIVAIEEIPKTLPYGFGRSYLAGLLSVVPTLVSRIPILNEAVTFTTSLPEKITFALGGSFIAEAYYNFNWFGLLIPLVCGWFVGYTQTWFERDEKCFDHFWAPIVAIVLLLFVRGYFTDMVMKLVYTRVFIWCVNNYLKSRTR